jgi:ankyrin repeat protein
MIDLPWNEIYFGNINSTIALLKLGEDSKLENEKECYQDMFEFALWQGWFEIADVLMQRGVDINGKDNRQTLLHQSISDEKLELTQRLIEYGADINRHCYVGSVDTPLHRAVYTKQLKIVELLIEAGVQIDLPDCMEITATELAATRGDREMVALLLSRGAAISIHVAAAIGDLQTVERYLKTGGDPNIRLGTGYGCPPLFIAAAHDRIEIAKLLIESGAELNLECGQDDFDILAACRHGSCEMVRLLVEHGARTDLYNFGGDMICNATSHGRTDIVRLAIEEYKLSADRIYPYLGYYLFDFCATGQAASSGQIETLEFLISQGASIPNSAIYQAAENGHYEMVEFLADRKIDPNFTTLNETAIVKVAGQRDLLMVQTLLSVGADINAGADTGNWTALHRAAVEGHLEMVRFLVANGAEVNAKIDGWLTPLEYACGKRYDDVIDFLVKNGAKG